MRCPCDETSPISRLSRFGVHGLQIFSLGQQSLANATGNFDQKNNGLADALEEHRLDSHHALHATGTTRHS
jgi:hypothetical protein